MANGRINIAKIRATVAQSRVIDEYAVTIINKKFKQTKAEMLRKFDEHKVTQEILSGPEGDNISDTLKDAFVPGNLCAFLGFENDGGGEEAILHLRNILDEQTTLTTTPVLIQSGDKLIYRFTGKVPTPEEIQSQTPVPWGDTARGRSWVAIIENGTNSFSYYLYKRWEAGRSHEALQAKTKGKDGEKGRLIVVNQGTFHRTSYTTAIINSFIRAVGTTETL